MNWYVLQCAVWRDVVGPFNSARCRAVALFLLATFIYRITVPEIFSGKKWLELVQDIVKLGVLLQVTYTTKELQGADKSLARPTSRCRRTESVVSLEIQII
jgi:hypothetical protein